MTLLSFKLPEYISLFWSHFYDFLVHSIQEFKILFTNEQIKNKVIYPHYGENWKLYIILFQPKYLLENKLDRT